MKNLLADRISRREKKAMELTGALPVLLIMIFLEILRLLGRLLKKFRRGIRRLSVAVLVIYGLCSFFIQVANAPKANAQVPFVGTPITEHEQIVAYIEKIFGKDAPKAFLLLHGNGKCSGENGSLNPDAQNYNSDSIHSVDIGVFQINNYWQKVQPKFLYNWKINIEIAHQLYKENGNKFNLWTGGKCQGI